MVQLLVKLGIARVYNIYQLNKVKSDINSVYCIHTKCTVLEIYKKHKTFLKASIPFLQNNCPRRLKCGLSELKFAKNKICENFEYNTEILIYYYLLVL